MYNLDDGRVGEGEGGLYIIFFYREELRRLVVYVRGCLGSKVGERPGSTWIIFHTYTFIIRQGYRVPFPMRLSVTFDPMDSSGLVLYPRDAQLKCSGRRHSALCGSSFVALTVVSHSRSIEYRVSCGTRHRSGQPVLRSDAGQRVIICRS